MQDGECSFGLGSMAVALGVSKNRSKLLAIFPLWLITLRSELPESAVPIPLRDLLACYSLQSQHGAVGKSLLLVCMA